MIWFVKVKNLILKAREVTIYSLEQLGSCVLTMKIALLNLILKLLVPRVPIFVQLQGILGKLRVWRAFDCFKKEGV